MGAALTYARRYALFTLVGIAGEDDLDAPDLAFQKVVPASGPPIKGNGFDELRPSPPTKPFQEARKGPNGKPLPILSREASATLRDQLLAELEGLELKDLDAWTFQAWPKANTLTPADGDEVGVAFQARLGRLQTIPDEDLSPAELDPPAANDETRSRIDKSVLALPEAKRLKDRQHLRFVAKQPCLVCGREPSDPHHLRFAQTRGLAQKVSDEFTVQSLLQPCLRCRTSEAGPNARCLHKAFAYVSQRDHKRHWLARQTEAVGIHKARVSITAIIGTRLNWHATIL